MKQKTRQQPTREKRETPTPLSPLRRKVFTLTLVLFPLLVLGVVEIALRIFHYDGDLELVSKRTIGGKEFYSINRFVARRYFAQAGTTVPEPADDTFEMHKQQNTKRIFCLGESTMAGFPYEFNATAPGFLRDRLKALFPHNTIEVINVGLSAVGSFVVLDFMEELMNYEPDLFIIYLGHNEFYGAYGVGSKVAIRGGAGLTRLTLRLLKFKTFLLLRDAYVRILSRFSPPASNRDTGTLMQQMASEKTIPLHSPLYHEAQRIYEDNLKRIIREAHEKGIPVLFSTLVSNLKDHPPFVSVFDEQTTDTRREEWRRLMAAGENAMTHRHVDSAATLFSAATLVDSANASGFFKLGTALYAQEKFDAARDAFVKAKDRDALRFRATEEFQNILIKTCNALHVPLARVDSAFAANSPHGIVGNELVLEHLHPNIEGYFLMAKTIAATLRRERLFGSEADWNEAPTLSDSVMMEESAVTDFDRLVGTLKIEFLKHRWPFVGTTQPYEFHPGTPVEEIALRYARQEIAWSDARYRLAEYYAGIHRFDRARSECRAVSKVIPFSYNPLLRVADYYLMEGKKEEAKRAYWTCVQTEDNPFARMNLGWRYLDEEKPDSALRQLQIAFEVNETFHDKLTPQGLAGGRYLLAVAYAKLGNFDEAKRQAEHALALQPGYAEARELLEQLNRVRH